MKLSSLLVLEVAAHFLYFTYICEAQSFCRGLLTFTQCIWPLCNTTVLCWIM